MTTAQAKLADVESKLQDKKREAQQQVVREAEAELKVLRHDAKALRGEYAEIAERVVEGDRIVTACREQLSNIASEISRVQSESEDPLDDPEDREAEIAALQHRREEVFAEMKRGEALTEDRMKGIGIAQKLENMAFQARNLKTLIANGGFRRNGWQGGVATVR